MNVLVILGHPRSKASIGNAGQDRLSILVPGPTIYVEEDSTLL